MAIFTSNLIKRIPFSLFVVWFLVALAAFGGVLPGCSNERPILAPQVNVPVSAVQKEVAEIDVKAAYIKSLASKVVGDANKMLKSLIVDNAAGIQDNVVIAREQIKAVIAVNEVLIDKFNQQNGRLDEKNLELKRKELEIKKLNSQFFSPFQIRWFWRVLIGFTIFQVVTGVVLGRSGSGIIQTIGKAIVRFLPAMNLTSFLRDRLQARKLGLVA